jgi:hypothetical protein
MRQRRQAITALLKPKPIAVWCPATLGRNGNADIANLVAALGQKELPGNTIPGPVMAVEVSGG